MCYHYNQMYLVVRPTHIHHLFGQKAQLFLVVLGSWFGPVTPIDGLIQHET